MKELVIISGKGGTGKTSVTASFSVLAKNAVLVDCDVDAADLHLVLKPTAKEKFDFWSGFVAEIDKNACIECGKCMEACRFSAIYEKELIHQIDPLSCEGCRVCEVVCPVNAIKMKDNLCGAWFISKTRAGTMIHAELNPGSENSGKLVSTIRQKAKEIAKEINSEFIIIDGPPGIGCPVIASTTGASMALIVTEPSKSGLHDLERVAKLTTHFKIPTYVCINKFDINPKLVSSIEDYCFKNEIKIIGKIMYDLDFVKAVLNESTVVETSNGQASNEIKKMWEYLKYLMEK